MIACQCVAPGRLGLNPASRAAESSFAKNLKPCDSRPHRPRQMPDADFFAKLGLFGARDLLDAKLCAEIRA